MERTVLSCIDRTPWTRTVEQTRSMHAPAAARGRMPAVPSWSPEPRRGTGQREPTERARLRPASRRRFARSAEALRPARKFLPRPHSPRATQARDGTSRRRRVWSRRVCRDPGSRLENPVHSTRPRTCCSVTDRDHRGRLTPRLRAHQARAPVAPREVRPTPEYIVPLRSVPEGFPSRRASTSRRCVRVRSRSDRHTGKR